MGSNPVPSSYQLLEKRDFFITISSTWDLVMNNQPYKELNQWLSVCGILASLSIPILPSGVEGGVLVAQIV